MCRAIEVVKSHALSDARAGVGAHFENLPGKGARADIPAGYARHVGDEARLIGEGGHPFREGGLSGGRRGSGALNGERALVTFYV